MPNEEYFKNIEYFPYCLYTRDNNGDTKRKFDLIQLTGCTNFTGRDGFVVAVKEFVSDGDTMISIMFHNPDTSEYPDYTMAHVYASYYIKYHGIYEAKELNETFTYIPICAGDIPITNTDEDITKYALCVAKHIHGDVINEFMKEICFHGDLFALDQCDEYCNDVYNINVRILTSILIKLLEKQRKNII